MLGGEGTDIPLRREIVAPFAIAETEVTNQQYQEFVQATDHQPPTGWKGKEFPSGAATEPVTGVTWLDADAYCKWLSEKVNARVELPTEAEWELAARGKQGFKYPWGNQWNSRAAVSEGKIRPVKSYPEGKSPVGAYDMAGNVWEWVADQALDEEGKPKTENGVAIRIIKGGSADEEREYISARARFAKRPADSSRPTIGFRYVVKRAPQTSTPAPTP
jgi:formylglycine-generating enzyme required for sulfatase activity